MSTVDPRLPHSPSRPQSAEAPGAARTPEFMPALSDRNPPRLGPLPVAPSQRLVARLARSLRRRWLSASFFGLLGGCLAAAAIWQYAPHQHAAEVWLRINHAPRETDKEDAPAALIKTPLVLNAALKQPALETWLKNHPQAKPLDWLEQHVSADAPAPETVRVRATGQHPEEPAMLADAVATAYLQEIDAKQQAHLAQTKNALQQVQEQLRTQRASLAALPTGVDPRQAQVESERQLLRLERSRLQAELSVLKGMDKTTAQPNDAELTEAIKNDPVIQECTKAIDRLTTQMKDYERISAQGANDPAVAKLAAQQEGWKTKATHRRIEIAASMEQRLTAKAREQLQAKREALETRLAGLDELEKRLDAEAKSFPAPNADQPSAQTLRADIDTKQETARRLDAELQTLEEDAKSGPSVARLGDTRHFPHVNSTQRLLNTGIGGGVTFLFLALVVGLIDTRDKRVRVAGDLVHLPELPIIGTLPSLRAPPVESDAASPNPLAEAVDTVRTLLLRRTGGGPCVLMVTSAGDGEGKTMLASHLAASLARIWRKTLLIDGDLRKPATHKVFKLAAEPGLSDVLRCEADAEDVVQPTGLSRLWLLSAGRTDSHASQALAQQDSAAFLDGLREEYEFIVIDSSAVLTASETLLLSQYVDVVVLAVRCGKSQLPSVRAAQQRLNAMSAPFFGAIVLGCS